jgi:hypothetical protein
MFSTIAMASNTFFSMATSLTTSITNMVSGLRNDFQQGLDLIREPGVLLSPESDTFFDTNAPHVTNWIETHDVGNEATKSTRGAGQPSHQEERPSFKDQQSAQALLTSALFAKVDLQMTGIYLQVLNDDTVTEESQNQTALSVQKIQEKLCLLLVELIKSPKLPVRSYCELS